ncbi:glycoside hydrolase family 97 protein [Bacteroides sp.]|uniref:glycoside hydrolase family 97 protein n=1 Tax=Bacteroides sp. TaxID=29523 RepID=UPI002590BF45|nr:glycoside hydrolase family 97 protein [Bacteroides sp.]
MRNCVILICCVLFNVVQAVEINSPGGKLQLAFRLSDGVPAYSLSSEGKRVMDISRLGFLLADHPDMNGGFSIEKIDSASFDETWKPVWGEVSEIRNNYNELCASLKDDKGRLMNIRFRLYDDGLGFRYEFPRQHSLAYFFIEEELTEFNLGADCSSFWIPGDYDSNEFVYQKSNLSNLSEVLVEARKSMDSKTIIDNRSVQTPVLFRNDNGMYINIHEAALKDYPSMCLTLQDSSYTFKSNLTPDPKGYKGRIQSGFNTPWRTIIVSDDAAGILESKLVLNLNEPCKLKNTGWIKPMKYVGVWWEMFVPWGSSWNYTDDTNIRLGEYDYSKARPNGRHGANTENVKRYIDFAAEHGFGGVLVEGWNEGWEDWFDKMKFHVFDYKTPYPDFDIEQLSDYAESKGVTLIMHHETSGSTMNYERLMPEAYGLMNRYGYKAVKSGYVGRLYPVGEYHYGQTFINHCLYAIEKAAEHKIMVNVHEAPKPTGMHRTYPNYLACESARGTEYEAFAYNKPEHTTILPFTRLIGGPMDYTPGIFQLDFNYYDKNSNKTLSSTLAKQLGLYVVIYSPLQMAADLPKNYERFMDAFQFIKDVPVDWQDTKVLEAEPGEYVTIARKDKKSNDWYVGNTTGENRHVSQLNLDFLDKGKKYKAVIYSDGADAHYRTNPMSYRITEKTVDYRSKIKVAAAPGGGYAISISEIK